MPFLAHKHAWCSRHQRINTTVRTLFNAGGANTALAVTTASVNKTANATSTPHQQRCWWTPTALLHHRHRLQLTSYIFSPQPHRVLRSSPTPAYIFYCFISASSHSTATSSSTSSAIVSSPASSCSTSTVLLLLALHHRLRPLHR